MHIVLKAYCRMDSVSDLSLITAPFSMMLHSVVPKTNVLPWRTRLCHSSLGKSCWAVSLKESASGRMNDLFILKDGLVTDTCVYFEDLHYNLCCSRREYLKLEESKWFVVSQNKCWIRTCGYWQGFQLSRSFPRSESLFGHSHTVDQRLPG